MENGGLTCHQCRADCADNDAVPECDTTGVPCLLRAVELDPANQPAWELYHLLRLPVVAEAVLALRGPRMVTEEEAGALAVKLEALAAEYAKLELEERQRLEAELKASRHGG